MPLKHSAQAKEAEGTPIAKTNPARKPTTKKVDGASVGMTFSGMTFAEWREPFLNELRRKPIVSAACRTVGVNRRTVYDHRAVDEEFEKDWDAAIDDGRDYLEEKMFNKAMQGNVTLQIFLSKVWRYGASDGYGGGKPKDKKLQVSWE